MSSNLRSCPLYTRVGLLIVFAVKNKTNVNIIHQISFLCSNVHSNRGR